MAEGSGHITIKLGHDKYKIPLWDIVYLEAMKDYTKVVSVLKQYLVLETITGLHHRNYHSRHRRLENISQKRQANRAIVGFCIHAGSAAVYLPFH